MNIGYFAPSYKRPEMSSTQLLYPFVKIVVRESEAEEYEKNGNEIVTCPDSAQGNLCRVRNWILDTYQDDFDCIVLLDDDHQGFGVWQNQKWRIMEGDEFAEFCEINTILCKEFGYRFWGINIVTDKGAYREYTPFGTTSYIGGPMQCFLKDNFLRYDESLPLKEDYDITLQNMVEFGGALRVNYASYRVKQSEQEGGCATYRNLEKEKEQFKLLQKKWGSEIVKQDKGSKRSFDYNPVIKVPIKGV